MLEITARRNKAYCQRHEINYESLIGIKRGYHAWHACFNRILVLKEKLDFGFKGWFIYIDADAYVHDMSFDVKTFLSERENFALIAAHGGTQDPWDMNDGIFFMNFAHPDAAVIINAWHASFMQVADADMRSAVDWEMIHNDNVLLYLYLRSNPGICGSIAYESYDIINSQHAVFVRQVLRVAAATFEERLALLKAHVDESAAWNESRRPSIEVKGRLPVSVSQ